MAYEIKRTAVMTLFGRRDELLLRYGTMRNLHRVVADLIPSVKTPHLLGLILDGEACRPEQAQEVEKAVLFLTEKPQATLKRILDSAYAGEPVSVSVLEALNLRDVLCLPEPESESGSGAGVYLPTGSDQRAAESV